MQKHSQFSRISLVVVSLVLVFAMLAITLPEKAQAALSPGTLNAWVQNGKIYVKLSGFTEKNQLRLKVREATQGIGGWKSLGTVKVDRKTDTTTTFPIPKTLAKKIYLNVCMKNMTTNVLTCKVVVNPGY